MHIQSISFGVNVNSDMTSPSGYTMMFNYDIGVMLSVLSAGAFVGIKKYKNI